VHWKILRDPFLGPLARVHGEQFAWDAGFFFDDDPEDASLDDTDWLCTPVPPRRPLGQRPIVLLSTGGFCPIHVGHLAMMDAARECATNAGFDVVAGYLSPGHDAYLRGKCGDEAIPASVRLQQCADAAATRPWLLVDPWEALHRRVAVNYTDVVARLRAYLRVHHDARIEVFYVCGGDNARFAQAFSRDGGCVVVSRPGSENEVQRCKERLGEHPNILWCEGGTSASSRTMRGGPWEEGSQRNFVARLEDERAAPRLGLQALQRFQRELLSVFGAMGRVRTVAFAEEARSQHPIISLDPMHPTSHTIAMSRLFAPGGYQQLGHIARPGSAPLAEQFAAIEPGDYELHDDDSVTGGTLQAVRAAMPDGIRIVSTTLATAHAPDEEVIDCRDFLLGAHESGLVTRLPWGAIGRVPYLLPYVDPAARCSVAPQMALQFSRQVWLLNAAILRDRGLCVGDLSPSVRDAFVWFGVDRPLHELALWHAGRLARLLGTDSQ